MELFKDKPLNSKDDRLGLVRAVRPRGAWFVSTSEVRLISQVTQISNNV